jgi:transposase-like protein
MTDTPQSLIEAVRYFSDRDTCEAYMRKIRWPSGTVECPHCGAKGKRIGEIATRHMLRCKDCRKQFSSRVGTIFGECRLELNQWFIAVFDHATGEPSTTIELASAMGCTQKTAWFARERIRIAVEFI